MDDGFFLEAAIGIGCCALAIIYVAVLSRYSTRRWSFFRLFDIADSDAHDLQPYESVAERMRSDPSCTLSEGVRDFLLADQKIEAIKLYRIMTDASLREAKAAVDAAERELRESQTK